MWRRTTQTSTCRRRRRRSGYSRRRCDALGCLTLRSAQSAPASLRPGCSKPVGPLRPRHTCSTKSHRSRSELPPEAGAYRRLFSLIRSVSWTVEIRTDHPFRRVADWPNSNVCKVASSSLARSPCPFQVVRRAAPRWLASCGHYRRLCCPCGRWMSGCSLRL